MNESLIEAAQTANLLTESIRAAHKKAVLSNPLAEILLRDALDHARQLEARLSEIQASVDSN